MITSHKILPLVLVFASLVMAMSAEAQIRVRLKMSKSQYVAHEPVKATITITNHAGRDLVIYSEGAGRGTISWLDFALKTSRGAALTPLSRVSFPAVKLPAGRSISKTVNLAQLYSVTEVGNFRGHAVVRLPNDGGIFNSNSESFSVTKGQRVYTQRVGDPNRGNLREYGLSVFNSGEKSSLYVHVTDVRTGRTIRTFRLGEALTFKKPRATVDRNRNLHVLYLTAPSIYGHAQVTPDGRLVGTQYYKRASGKQPSLTTFANGEVVVAGAVAYNPDAARERRAQIRRLSERPNFIYR